MGALRYPLHTPTLVPGHSCSPLRLISHSCHTAKAPGGRRGWERTGRPCGSRGAAAESGSVRRGKRRKARRANGRRGRGRSGARGAARAAATGRGQGGVRLFFLLGPCGASWDPAPSRASAPPPVRPRSWPRAGGGGLAAAEAGVRLPTDPGPWAGVAVG